MKELLQVINPDYINYLTGNSNLSDDIKKNIGSGGKELPKDINAATGSLKDTRDNFEKERDTLREPFRREL